MGKRGEKREGGEVHLNVILIRRPLPLLINEILVIGKVVVAISRPLGLCTTEGLNCGHRGGADPLVISVSPEEPPSPLLPPILPLSHSIHPREQKD